MVWLFLLPSIDRQAELERARRLAEAARHRAEILPANAPSALSDSYRKAAEDAAAQLRVMQSLEASRGSPATAEQPRAQALPNSPQLNKAEHSSQGAISIMRVINIIALVLLIVGGLNWGLVGLFDFDLVAAIFGAGSTLARIVYILVGVSALICLGLLGREGRYASSSHAV